MKRLGLIFTGLIESNSVNVNTKGICCYFTPDERVSMLVCLFVRSLISRTMSKLHEISAHITRGRGWVLLRLQCNALRISGFVDDVMFSHNGSYGEWC